MAQHLAQAEPDRAGRQRDLSVSYARVGNPCSRGVTRRRPSRTCRPTCRQRGGCSNSSQPVPRPPSIWRSRWCRSQLWARTRHSTGASRHNPRSPRVRKSAVTPGYPPAQVSAAHPALMTSRACPQASLGEHQASSPNPFAFTSMGVPAMCRVTPTGLEFGDSRQSRLIDWHSNTGPHPQRQSLWLENLTNPATVR